MSTHVIIFDHVEGKIHIYPITQDQFEDNLKLEAFIFSDDKRFDSNISWIAVDTKPTVEFHGEVREPLLSVSVNDVFNYFNCTREEAIKVIESLQKNEYVGSTINEMIVITGQEFNLERKQEENE